ncbi:hypothetical protein [Nostoc sp. CHAB 5715]|uniref:hypothetical protein n=1 Tax=Nostoc sp. CHAB 5715 TaxID=2780400 RepID=UPI001E355800|nr:hypothetical protein [Nostoc sp. CHAB 5715]MCC5621731.1 hypothetical protein [Nostoc sp. CHAB 5715]
MKNSDVKDRHDIQLKIQQLRQGSGYVRKLLLAICGTSVASLLTILPMTAGQIAIYILLDNQKITIDLWRLLLILIFASGLFIPVVRGLEVASIANVLMLVFIGAFSGFFLAEL